MTLIKKLRKMVENMKNSPKRGKSARNGNRPAPYTKYSKTPHRYSAAYYEWHKARKAGKPAPTQDWKANNRVQVREYREAAE